MKPKKKVPVDEGKLIQYQPSHILLSPNQVADPVFMAKLGAILFDDPNHFTPKP